METLYFYFGQIADTNELAANFILVFAFIRWAYNQTTIKLKFIETSKEGVEIFFTVELKRSDLSAQNLTNIISHKRYAGGFIPADVRSQIISFTNPDSSYSG